MNELLVFVGLWTSMGVAVENQVSCPGVCTWDSNDVVNPLGTLEVGGTWRLGTRVEVEVGARHESMIFVHDGGRDQIFLRTKIWLRPNR